MATTQLIFRRILFLLLTIFSVYIISVNLYSSWFYPPPQTRLDRVQTDLVIQALSNDRVQNVLGNSMVSLLYKQSLEEYLQTEDLSEVLYQIGLLEIYTGNAESALARWQNQADPLAQAMYHLWQPIPSTTTDVEFLIKQKLKGWYKYIALKKLYTLQHPNYLEALQIQQNSESEAATARLLLINSIPILGSLVGCLCLGLFCIRFRHSVESIWQTPWDQFILWEVMVSWFCSYIFLAQFIPILLQFLGLDSGSPMGRATVIGITYGLSMAPILPILFLVFRSSKQEANIIQLQCNSPQMILWALGGYFSAIPLVVLTSIGQQVFIRGHGGGNPLLDLIANHQSYGSILILWITLSVAAPFFEELIFRGFLLPSLTKYMPPGVAIVASGCAFAIAHLNINDLLPLSILGIVLGTVYYRTKNLAAPMLVHSLWNTGSFISLLILTN